jgi:hypothetical protein
MKHITFHTYHTKFPFGDFNAEVGKDSIFELSRRETSNPNWITTANPTYI